MRDITLAGSITEIKDDIEIRKSKILKRCTFKFIKVFNLKYCSFKLYFYDEKKRSFLFKRGYRRIPFEFLCLNFDRSIKYKKKIIPPFLKLNKTILSLMQKEKSFIEVLGFPYTNHPGYFPLTSFQFDRNTLIVGQTGSGKSKLIEIIVNELSKNNLEGLYSIVVIDPHASLHWEGLGKKSISIDFLNDSCDLFLNCFEPKSATELTLLLFQSLVEVNSNMERFLKYSLFTLLSSNLMSANSLKKFLTELEFRKEVLAKNTFSENISQFFETDFLEMQTKYYESVILPILALIDELNFLPSFNGKQSQSSLQDLVNSRYLVYFPLNRIYLGDKALKLISGLIIQQIFLLVQSNLINRKVLLIIDEVSLIENRAFISILSEARKFGLSLFLAQQYLTQISSELLNSILSNVYNYFIFKVSSDDAKVLSKNISMEVFAEDQKSSDEENLKIKFLTSLNPRECLVRVFCKEQFLTAFKGRTIDI